MCRERSGVLQSHLMMDLVPRDIKRHIHHQGDNAQIEGFRKLFDYLNTDPAADDLRQLVVNYFNDRPCLRSHLREPLSGRLFLPLSTMDMLSR